MPIRVVIADDHGIVRAGIRALLQNLSGVTVVGEADNGREVLGLVDRLRPDIVLLDIAMPELSGLEAAARIKRDYENVRVIMLSMHPDREYVLRALRAGASGYMIKGGRGEELELALLAVAGGDMYLSPQVTKYLVQDFIEHHSQDKTNAERLTPRQREILQLIGEGHTRKDIALKLNISVKTFDKFRAQLLHALGVNDNAGLIRTAIAMSLVNPPDASQDDKVNGMKR